MQRRLERGNLRALSPGASTRLCAYVQRRYRKVPSRRIESKFSIKCKTKFDACGPSERRLSGLDIARVHRRASADWQNAENFGEITN